MSEDLNILSTEELGRLFPVKITALAREKRKTE
jgi:hypothetical protein